MRIILASVRTDSGKVQYVRIIYVPAMCITAGASVRTSAGNEHQLPAPVHTGTALFPCCAAYPPTLLSCRGVVVPPGAAIVQQLYINNVLW